MKNQKIEEKCGRCGGTGQYPQADGDDDFVMVRCECPAAMAIDEMFGYMQANTQTKRIAPNY